jgi:predicted dehydrogenase
MNRELRIGVIGAGGRGGLAGHAHRPEHGVRVVAGADVVPGALERFRARYGPDAFTTADYRQLLQRDDVDAVFVTSPDFCHEEQAVAALAAGKAVYLEKPMAITVAGCDRILATCAAHRGKLYLGHNMRHMNFVLQMKKLIDDGAIGEPKAGWCRHFVGHGGKFYFQDWHADRTKSTGLLLQKGAHDIDVLHWLCRGYTRRVTAFGGLTVYGDLGDRDDRPVRDKWQSATTNWPPRALKSLNPVVDVEDISMMLMELDNGVFCSYQQCHYTPDYWRNYTIIGTDGRLENFGNGEEGSFIAVWNSRTGYKPQGDRQVPAPATAGSHGGADPAIVDEFIRFVRDAAPATTSPVAARYSVVAGVKATESLRAGGQPREVPPLDAAVAEYFG